MRVDLIEQNEEVTSLNTVHVIQTLLVGEDCTVFSDELVRKALGMVEVGGVTRLVV